MGGSNLELFRMCLYVSFPIVVFYLTNTPYYSNKQSIRKRPVIENEENTRQFKEQMKKIEALKKLKAID